MFNKLCLASACAVSVLVGCAIAPPPVNPLQQTYFERIDEASEIAADVEKSLLRKTSAEVIEGTKRRIAHDLRDPESARFREVALIVYEGRSVVCGEVNSKNGYGGYVGFQPFIGGPAFGRVLDDLTSAPGASDSAGYRTYCLLGKPR
ncbi:hypothetical protein [Comamonas suwonensis]|uniref:Lipoprotein n=1 Tax=Comamonas suwonensis TaxID=2606214 RepID=A0A843BFV5_9BURK|nr:hypothetical protein [Comamonas suwonensis]MBI1627017.1 hypothetical protein [Comamonas suwonensis]